MRGAKPPRELRGIVHGGMGPRIGVSETDVHCAQDNPFFSLIKRMPAQSCNLPLIDNRLQRLSNDVGKI